jgi:hypothetical protein
MNSCMLMSLLVSDLENFKCFIFVAQSVTIPSLLQCHFLEQSTLNFCTQNLSNPFAVHLLVILLVPSCCSSFLHSQVLHPSHLLCFVSLHL